MKRSEFFSSIFLSGLGLIIPGQLKGIVPKTTLPHSPTGSKGPSLLNSRQQIKLLSSNVAGYQYYKGHLIEHEFKTGVPLTLVREPKNRYDRNAIAIYFGLTKIGYIPAALNTVLSNMLDQGVHLETTITAFNPEMPTWGRVEVEIVLNADCN
jgi:hypothetical protein